VLKPSEGAMALELGKLEKIDPRTAWETEDRHFTPWLAEESNIALLSSALGLDLEVEAQEKQVGPFRADILCRDVQSDAYVLIENQLEKTDHKHLGQLMTYAAGLKTAYIIWIAHHFQDEHRAALDWLNSITDDEFKFFGLEVELWRIGESAIAPKFNIVSKPNEWSRDAKDGLRKVDQGKSETKLKQRDYWIQFSDYLLAEHDIQAQKARPQHWLIVSIGSTDVKISCTVNTKTQALGVELYIFRDDDKETFNYLLEQKEKIERDIGLSLDWQELPEKKASRVAVYKSGFSLDDNGLWKEFNSWAGQNVAKFKDVFSQYLSKQ